MFSPHSPKPQFAPIYLRLPAMPTMSSPTIFCSKDIHIYTPPLLITSSRGLRDDERS